MNYIEKYQQCGKVTNTEKDKKDVNLLSRYQQPSDATNENNK